MTNADFDDLEGGERTPLALRVQRIVNRAGVVLSVALVAGVAVWGYRIAVRDVSGVPVVRALEGPMREAPAQPGGMEAANQGLSVNSVAAAGIAGPVPDRLTLAPRPAELAPDDAPGLSVEGPVVPPPAELAMQGPPVPAEAVALAAASASGAVPAEPPAPPAGPVGAAPVDPVAAALAEVLAETPEADAPEDDGRLAGLRPVARPSVLTAAPAPAPAAAPAPEPAVVPASVQPAAAVPVAEVDPASLPVGTRLVQLGAFDDVETARAEWDRIAGRFAELMGGKARVIQTAQSGGRTFVRLRAQGFENEDDARRFCSALLAEGAACIPVAVR